MKFFAAAVVLVAVLLMGCGSSSSSTAEDGAGDVGLTRADLAADWEDGITSKGRWFARFASPMQIAFSCDASSVEARRYHREFEGAFSESLLTEFEAACERGGSGSQFYKPPRAN